MAMNFFSVKLTWPCLRSARAPMTWSSVAASAAPMASKASSPRALFISAPPEVKEVEPVVRGGADMLFQQRRVPLNGRLYGRFALPWRNLGKVGQRLKRDCVPIAAPIQADHENHRPPHDGCGPHGSDREARGLPEKCDAHTGFIAERAIAQHADKRAAIQVLLDFEHGINVPERND